MVNVASIMKSVVSLVARAMYWLMGWRFDPLPAYFGDKHVIIGFPHTSNMDTVRAFTGFLIAKKTGHVMVKREWFFWPMSIVLGWLGGVPVDRSASIGVVRQMVTQFNDRDEFLLAIVPEGTRKGVSTVKTGFWYIAKAAGVSIICWYLDNENRCTRWLGEVIPGESKRDDLLLIQKMYEKAGYRFPLVVSDR